MRWSDRNEDNLETLLRDDGNTKLGAALTELRDHKTEPPQELRERVRTIAASEPAPKQSRLSRFTAYRPRFAHAAALGAAVLLVAIAIPVALTNGQGTSESADAGPADGTETLTFEALRERGEAGRPLSPPATPETLNQGVPQASPPPPPMPLAPTASGGGGAAPQQGEALDSGAVGADKAAPLPSPTRAQDYSASIKLHVGNHDELSDAVQSAIRSTRQLGGYVTYVDYGTSGEKDGEATLAVRVPVGRVQAAVAQFSQLGTILEQQTEIVDLQGRIDRITRDIQQRRDRIAKLEAELKDPTLSDAERTRLEARIVQAKRGLANAQRGRAGVIRQSRFAKLDLAFTTEKREEPAAPPSELRKTLDDAVGILLAELAIGLFVLIVAAPILFVLWLTWRGLRLTRRLAGDRLLEAS
jgi:hypothetical protein